MGTAESVCWVAGWGSGMGRKLQPLCLGPALGKQASFCPDSHCLKTVCRGTGQAWAATLPRPQDSLGQAGEAATPQGGELMKEQVKKLSKQARGRVGEVARQRAVGPFSAEARGAGGRPWHTQWTAAQAGPGLQAGPPGSDSILLWSWLAEGPRALAIPGPQFPPL